jgi:hypothetical protein
VKHWAFNDPLKREGAYVDAPPSPEEYRKLATRIVDLHPMTIMQNALHSFGGDWSWDRCGWRKDCQVCSGERRSEAGSRFARAGEFCVHRRC